MSEPAVQTHCRIGKVRFKNGAEMTVLRQPELSEKKARLVRDVRELVEDERTVDGYVVVVIRDAHSSSVRIEACDSFPTRCLPEYAAESIRRVMWGD
jgi:hypothetical protein